MREQTPREGDSLATAMVNAPHASFVATGAVTDDPTRTPGYNADDPEPGTLLFVVDREGWATLHRIESRALGLITFGPRIPWPDGTTAARKVPDA